MNKQEGKKFHWRVFLVAWGGVLILCLSSNLLLWGSYYTRIPDWITYLSNVIVQGIILFDHYIRYIVGDTFSEHLNMLLYVSLITIAVERVYYIIQKRKLNKQKADLVESEVSHEDYEYKRFYWKVFLIVWEYLAILMLYSFSIVLPDRFPWVADMINLLLSFFLMLITYPAEHMGFELDFSYLNVLILAIILSLYSLFIERAYYFFRKWKMKQQEGGMKEQEGKKFFGTIFIIALLILPLLSFLGLAASRAYTNNEATSILYQFLSYLFDIMSFPLLYIISKPWEMSTFLLALLVNIILYSLLIERAYYFIQKVKKNKQVGDLKA